MNGPIEMYGSPPYIDFHFNGSTEDYTIRIIEEIKYLLTVYGNFYANGWMYANNHYNNNKSNVVCMIDQGNSITFAWTADRRIAIYMDDRFVGYMTYSTS